MAEHTETATGHMDSTTGHIEATLGRRAKVIEWLRRYLPLEISGWVGELGAAWVAYASTGSLVVAAVAATVGSSVGYYLPAYVNAVRWTWPTLAGRTMWTRVALVNVIALRSLAVEFGIGEVIDSVVVRPGLYYLGPILLQNTVAGWVVGGFIADAAFYVCTIFSYERFGRWLAHPLAKRGESAEQTAAATDPSSATDPQAEDLVA
ncbi:hypothetical protein ACWDTD_06105 [Gordonia sp. NPDC003425]